MYTEYFYNLVKDLNCFGDLDVDGRIIAYYKKLWEELIAYFILRRHGPHAKRRLQQCFLAAGTSLLNIYLARIGGHADPLNLL
jgi:hypothetical protein